MNIHWLPQSWERQRNTALRCVNLHDFRSVTGVGIEATVNGRNVKVGSESLLPAESRSKIGTGFFDTLSGRRAEGETIVFVHFR